MKNHWQISDGLCAPSRSREFIGNASCDCWRRTSAEQRRHPRRCISSSGESAVISVKYEIDREDFEIDRRVRVEKKIKIKRLVDSRKVDASREDSFYSYIISTVLMRKTLNFEIAAI